jgi:alkanesulfonate monooxygenase SsuD/methylene tetrahydromethanopterin reductase-like flavin-dependent oxidoreductase (luciferase family)
MNFHADVFRRMGYDEVVDDVGKLYLSGRKAEAVAAVPDELIADVIVVGNPAQVREQLTAWSDAGVTMLLVGCGSTAEINALAEAVLAPHV